MQELFAEYDIDITDIILIHRYTYPPETSYSDYLSGRMCYGFVYAESGSAVYKYDGKSITIKENQILFLPKDSKYSVENQEKIGFCHYTLNFSCIPDKRKNGILYEFLNGHDILLLNDTQNFHYKNCFLRVLDTWNNKKGGFRLSAKSQLYNILFDFFSDFAATKINKSDFERIRPAKDYIDKHYVDRISVKALSEMCGLSETHFRRLFNEIFKCPPLEYQINLRIMIAKDLLNIHMYSVCEVAEMCGFCDQNYFSRLFKLKTGVSPLKFRQIQ